MEIVRCSLSDFDDVALLERKYLSAPWSDTDLKTALSGNDGYALFKATKDGKTVGYGGVQTIADEGNITNVTVDEDARRQGVGSAIVEAIKSHCVDKGARRIYLEVCVNNSAAIKLYEKHGFEKAYARKNYYKDGDAAVMSCEVLCSRSVKA